MLDYEVPLINLINHSLIPEVPDLLSWFSFGKAVLTVSLDLSL